MAWFDAAWSTRRPVTVDNAAGAAKTNYAVKIELTSANFVFADAQADGEDVRVTDTDEVTLIDHWIESWDSVGETAVVWAEVPSIGAAASPTIYLYYGNAGAASASDIGAVFSYGEDFNDDRTGIVDHPTLGAATQILVEDQTWEDSAPHTLSVVEMNLGGFTYWGYYGLTGGGDGIGLAYSNDLVSWTKEAESPTGDNPVIDQADLRWPSVIDDGTTLHMFVRSITGNAHLERWTSPNTDGKAWAKQEDAVIPAFSTSPYIFKDPNSATYYLWYRLFAEDGGKTSKVVYRASSDLTAFATADEVTVFTTPAGGEAEGANFLLTPSMAHFDGKYWLYLETEFRANIDNEWGVYAFTADSPGGPFTSVSNNPIMTGGQACPFFYVEGATLHVFSCRKVGATWDLIARSATATAGAATLPHPWVGSLLPNSKQTPGLNDEGANKTLEFINPTATDPTYAVIEGLAIDDFRLACRVKRTNAFVMAESRQDGDTGAGYRSWINETTANIGITGGWDVSTSVAGTSGPHGLTWPLGYATVEFESLGTTHRVLLEGDEAISWVDATHQAAGWLSIEAWRNETNDYDWLYVRPYDGSDPTQTVGAAESGGTTVGRSVALQWDALSAIGEAEQLVWDAAAAVSDSAQLLWDVEGPVGDDLGLRWSTLTTVGETETLRWDVLTTVGESEQLVWDVAGLASVGGAVQLIWDVASDAVAVPWVVPDRIPVKDF